MGVAFRRVLRQHARELVPAARILVLVRLAHRASAYGWQRHYEGQAQQDLVKYFCYTPRAKSRTRSLDAEEDVKWGA